MHGHPFLRRRAEPLRLPAEREDATELQANLLDRVAQVMRLHPFPDGLGLSAIQVHVRRAVAVVVPPGEEPITLLNPVVEWEAGETEDRVETCLSSFDVREPVPPQRGIEQGVGSIPIPRYGPGRERHAVPARADAQLKPVPETERAPVAKTFRPYDPHQILLLPPSLDEWLPEGHLARFVSELVEEALDLSAIRAAYTEERGYPPYDPRLMLKLLIYGYCTGQRSSRGIEQRCWDDVAFRYLAAGVAPDYRSIARFRRRHLKALEGLFLQALRLCQWAGMVRLGKVALDGTKLRANTSPHKAMSYKRMVEREGHLEAEIDAMLAEAERQDAAEDERFGPDGRDDDLPEELNRRVDRLLKIHEAKQALEEEARRAAAEKAADAQKLDEQAKAANVEAAVSNAVPKPKAQRNFTDPDARIMKMSDGAFHECYNGQAAVDDAYQVIVAADTAQCAADAPSLLPMLEHTRTNCGRLPGQLLADPGYCAEERLKTLAENNVDALIATGRWSHGQPSPPAPRGRIPANATARERMARKTRTKAGRAAYARRKAIVEPVFGQMTILQGARYLLLRGQGAARSEWRLLCACHNLRKFFVVEGAAGLARLAPA
jgi:transposase